MSRRRSRGFALLDALVALLISGLALLTVFGGVVLAARAARAARTRLIQIVSTRNQDAIGQRLSFIQQIVPE